MAYAGVLKELGRGAIEIALTKTIGILTDEEYELLDDFRHWRRSGRSHGCWFRFAARTGIWKPSRKPSR